MTNGATTALSVCSHWWLDVRMKSTKEKQLGPLDEVQMIDAIEDEEDRKFHFIVRLIRSYSKQITFEQCDSVNLDTELILGFNDKLDRCVEFIQHEDEREELISPDWAGGETTYYVVSREIWETIFAAFDEQKKGNTI